MKVLISILSFLLSVQSMAGVFADRVSHVCPTAPFYESYALYNAEDYFWIFQDEKNFLHPRPQKSIVTLVNSKNTAQFSVLVFNRLTVYSWNEVGGTTSGAAYFLPKIQKALEEGWTVCDRSSTDKGIEQLEYILENGKMNSALSNSNK